MQPTSQGPCEHGVSDDVCWRCTLHGRTFPVSRPSLTFRERTAVLQVLDSGQITQAATVDAFEQTLAERLDVAYAIACTSGTTALHLALVAAEIGPGDEVLVPDLSFIATANAVTYTGATPVFCDVTLDRWALDLVDAASKISHRTRAILPVHLYGQPADMRGVLAFADAFGLTVIEDAAEGLGGHYDDRPLGTLGNLGVFSFYGNKLITTGEGGAVVTDDRLLRDRVRHLRGQGMTGRRYFHDVVGFNYRMTELQAALGLAQLARFGDLLSARKQVISTYVDAFRHTDAKFLNLDGAAPWLFTFLVPEWANRDSLMAHLAELGIDTRPTFVPAHDLPMYERPEEQFPVATYLGLHGLSLPTYPDLAPKEAQLIADIVLAYLRLAGPRASAPARKETVP